MFSIRQKPNPCKVAFKHTATALVGGLIFTGALSASAVEGPFLPPGDQKLLVVGQDTLSINNYVNSTSVVPGGVTGYINIGDLSGLTTNVDNGGGPNNMGELFQNYPESTLAIGVYLVNQLDQINAGQMDDQLDELIRVLASWERPVWLRWGYEFDGSWNAYDPTAFKNAWVRMYNKVQQAGASNIVMVWQGASYCGGTFNGNPIESWYPGDEFVDWVGMSYFTPQDCNNSAINTIVQFARSKNKPMMIAESAPQRYDLGELTYNPDLQRRVADQSRSATQIWNDWFANYFNFIDANADVIKNVAFINADWDSQDLWDAPYEQGYWGDTRVQANGTILNNWLSEIQNGEWLNASPELFDVLAGANPQPTPTPDPTPVVTPEPTPEPTPVPTPVETPVATSGEFGIESDGTLYHLDGGQTAGFVYLCLNGDCRTPALVNGRYERELGQLDSGAVFSIEFKVQDNATGQCIASASVSLGDSVDSQCVEGSPQPTPEPTPTADASSDTRTDPGSYP